MQAGDMCAGYSCCSVLVQNRHPHGRSPALIITVINNWPGMLACNTS